MLEKPIDIVVERGYEFEKYVVAGRVSLEHDSREVLRSWSCRAKRRAWLRNVQNGGEKKSKVTQACGQELDETEGEKSDSDER
eukprot:1452787-Pleurochrysis_carterae.AAC.1